MRLEHMKNRYTILFKVIILLLCVVCLVVMRLEYNPSETFAIVLSCIVTTVIVISKYNEIFACIDSNSKKLGFVLCWFYVTFSIIGVWYIDTDEINVIKVISVIILNSIWVFPVVLALNMMLVSLAMRIHSVEYVQKFSLTQKLSIIFTIIGLCVTMLVAFNPAITSPDSEECYAHAYNIILGLPITNDHPYFYKFLMSLLMRINTSISFVVLCQIVFYALVFAKGITLLNKLGISKKICVLIFVLFGISYNTVIQLVTLWKDIPYTISMLWLSILIAEYVMSEKGKIKIGRWWWLQFILASVFTSYIRHGGVIAVTIVLGTMLLTNNDKKRIGLCSIIIVFLLLVIRYPLYNALKVEDAHVKGFKYYGLTADIQYVYYMGGEVGEEELRLIESAANYDENPYNPFYVQNAWWNLDYVSMPDFIRMYMETFLDHPVLMTKSILIRSNYLWSIVKPARGAESCVARLTESHVYEDSLSIAIPARKENFLTNYLSKIVDYLNRFSLIHTVYWRVGIYVIGMLIVFLMMIAVNPRKSIKYIIPFFPIMFNDIVLVISCGSPSYRYYWPNMVLSSFLVPFGVVVLNKLQCNKKEIKDEQSVCDYTSI